MRAEFEADIRDFLGGKSSHELKQITKAIGQATRVIMAKLEKMERRMDVKVDDLLGAVEAQQSKIDSLIELSNQLHQRVLDAIGEDTLTPSQKMRIAQVFDAVNANSADIDAAMTANTVDATKGAVTDGPSAAQIKASTGPDAPAPADPGSPGSTESQSPAT